METTLINAVVEQIVSILAGVVIAYLGAYRQMVKKKLEDEQKERERQEKEMEALRHGVQAMLRDRIIQSYNHYCGEKKWIPIYAKASVENCFEVYETLGKNGVINDLMAQIRALPNIEPKDEVKKK